MASAEIARSEQSSAGLQTATSKPDRESGAQRSERDSGSSKSDRESGGMRLANAENKARLLEECQQLLGYQFNSTDILISALTHASSADSRVGSNERLEFLGDSVLGLVICEQLYHLFPKLLEGELTKIKSVVVSRRTCARISRQLGMERFLILGKGMATQAVIPASVLADVFESLIAAIYLDGGLPPAQAFILKHTRSEIEKSASGQHGENHKSILQQMAQKEFGATPTYEMLEEHGPDHSKMFKVTAVIGSLRYPAAWGHNKKEAEQRAALNALSQINGQDIPHNAEFATPE